MCPAAANHTICAGIKGLMTAGSATDPLHHERKAPVAVKLRERTQTGGSGGKDSDIFRIFHRLLL